ncbi:putative HTH-type transcriptional regulator [BD1-7 clade bacterium]|uniref:Putative HTH-type transcriptional regulator n=1 Tax=BD1-7 clade bacterium TaxID=2029982 RepID=A0A5S9NQN9_9GAMM|nr:putative HTH-type transcriptional regulator [BD1-7 clade bacterium]
MIKRLQSGHVSADYLAFLDQSVLDRGYPSLFSKDNSYDVISIVGLRYVSLETALKFFSEAIEVTRDTALGLDFGQRLNIMSHGPLTQALITAGSNRLFTSLFCKYIKTRHSLLNLSSWENHDTLILTLEVDIPSSEMYRFNIDLVFAAIANQAFEFTKQRQVIKAVTFSYPEPENITPYLKVFGDNVEFNAESNTIHMDTERLERIFTGTEAPLLQLAIKQCESLLKTMVSSDRTLDDIKALMTENEEGFPTQQELAKKLNVSSRSLSRRLEKLDTNYRQLLQLCKKERAEYYLRDTEHSIEQIAEWLGYDKGESFSRSFKVWTGISPSAFRKNKI